MKLICRAGACSTVIGLLLSVFAACSGAPTDRGGESGGALAGGGASNGGSSGSGGSGSGGKSVEGGSGGNGAGGIPGSGGNGAGGIPGSGGNGAGGIPGSGGSGAGGIPGSGGRGSGGPGSSGGAIGSGGNGTGGGAIGTGGTTGAAGGTGSSFDWGTTPFNANGGASVSYQGHFTGQTCINPSCHRHNITYGGTVYQSNGSSTAGNIQIGIRTGSTLVTTYSGNQGNFFGNISGASWATAQIAIRNASGMAIMPTNANASGECNSCHGSSNRIVVP